MHMHHCSPCPNARCRRMPQHSGTDTQRERRDGVRLHARTHITYGACSRNRTPGPGTGTVRLNTGTTGGTSHTSPEVAAPLASSPSSVISSACLPYCGKMLGGCSSGVEGAQRTESKHGRQDRRLKGTHADGGRHSFRCIAGFYRFLSLTHPHPPRVCVHSTAQQTVCAQHSTAH